MNVNHLTVCYHSGTGNSYRVAKWMAEAASEQGTVTEVAAIQQASGPQPAMPAGEDQMLVLAAPAHAFTAHWSMIRFALGVPRGKGAQAAVVLTRAGTKVGKRRLPGMEGTGCWLLAGILALKGYRVRGTLGLDMPSNWTQLHPGFAEPSVTDIIDHARPKAQTFMTDLLSGRRRLGGWLCLFLGIILLPVTLAYLLMGRFLLAKMFFASPKCTGCGQCARKCPAGAIRMVGWKTKRPYWSLTCHNCMRCMGYCPERAVEAGWSWAALLYYVASVPAVWLLMNHLLPAAMGRDYRLHWLVLWMIQYVYWLVSMAVAYGVFHLLLRVGPINWLFTLTTPTHVFRRYHEPQTVLDDLVGARQSQPATEPPSAC